MSESTDIGGATLTVYSRGIGRGLRVALSSSGTFGLDAAECRELARALELAAARIDAAEPENPCPRCYRSGTPGHVCDPWA